jgi:hypothetical protein
MAEALANPDVPHEALAERYGISRQSVDAMAETLRGIDLQAVSAVKAGLPALYALAAARHGLLNLQHAEKDPVRALKHAVAGKFSAETARVLAPTAERPGLVALTLIQTLHAGATAEAVSPAGPVLEAEAIAEPPEPGE